jgi:hypothetical protein
VLWLVNRYSYLIFAALSLLVGLLVGSRLGWPAGSALLVGLAAVLAVVQAALRGPSSLQDWREVEAAIGAGRPTLLFIYSDT